MSCQPLSRARDSLPVGDFFPKPARIHADDRINPRVEVPSATEHLDPQDGLFQAVGLSLQLALDAEFEEPDELSGLREKLSAR